MAQYDDLNLPPVLPYPSKEIQRHLPPAEWESCLDFWISSVEIRLSLSDNQFSKVRPTSLGLDFLVAYLSQHTLHEKSSSHSRADRLHKLCYSFLKRSVLTKSEQITPITLLELLSSGSSTFSQSESWKKILKLVWTSQQEKTKRAIEAAKDQLSASTSPKLQQSWLRRLSTLTRALPEIATVTVASADYLDTLTELYTTASSDSVRDITENVYYSFKALLESKHITILTDNIYHMKSESDRMMANNHTQTTILSSLLCTTSFLRHFSANSEIAARKKPLVDQLNTYRHDMLHLHPPPPRQRRKKGKGKAALEERIHIHRTAQVSQVHELFPNLSDAYILRTLDHYSEDVEVVIAALLEPNSLPLELQDQHIDDAGARSLVGISDRAPRSTSPLLPERKSVFDDDDFDQLQINSGQLRRGKKELSYDGVVDGSEHFRSKAAIMSALAAFDSDDDERDDTYDVADVGGAVDNTVDTDERRPPATDANEGTLYKTWKESSELFARDSRTRASNVRQQMKRETGMSDEQIEGWAIMLNKDKKMQDRLQDRYLGMRAFAGQQKVIESSKWQATSTENSDTESGLERSKDARRMGQAGIRGHRSFGNGRGRGGGSTSGPTGDTTTQQARRRKEQGRGRGGGNQRRDARAKKVGRGMSLLPQG